MSKEDLYVALIRYGIENISMPRSEEEIKDYITNQGYDFNKDVFTHIFREVFKITDNFAPAKYTLKSDAYFKLVEYDKLQEANRASLQAEKDSKHAFWVAFLSFVVSIGFSICQIVIPTQVTLAEKELKLLEQCSSKKPNYSKNRDKTKNLSAKSK